jgi:hypothetical protein
MKFTYKIWKTYRNWKAPLPCNDCKGNTRHSLFCDKAFESEVQ